MWSSLLAKLSFAPWQRAYVEAVRGRRGLEIGGPSAIFRRGNVLPLYSAVAALDCSNFAAETLWRTGTATEQGFQFAANKPTGKQFIREATDLFGIGDGAYDFVLASHVLEHVANPFKALAEIARVTTRGGALILVLPHRQGTFDHKRPVTHLSHLIEDLEKGTAEDDATHLDEWLRLVDLERAPEAKPFEAFRQRSLRNLENRGMHHHVFDTALSIAMIDRAGLQIVSVDHAQPCHILILAKHASTVNNAAFLSPQAPMYDKSPFSSDRNGDS